LGQTSPRPPRSGSSQSILAAEPGAALEELLAVAV
jgi:hypothetical protein